METKPLNRQVALYIEAAKKFGINYTIIHPAGLVRFSKNGKNTRIYKSQVEANNAVAALLSHNKYQTNRLLRHATIPCPKLSFCKSIKGANDTAKKIGYPLVLKPTKSSGGIHITAKISSPEELNRAVRQIQRHYRSFVLEQFRPGGDFRFLILDSRVIGIVKRVPPSIRGNGKQTVRSLIQNLPRVSLDDEMKRTLKEQRVNLSEILPNGRIVTLRRNANYSTGGQAIAVGKHTFHPKILKLAAKAAQTIGLTLAGVDMLILDQKRAPKENAVIIEVNSKPGIFIHHHPSRGKPQPVAETILKYLLHL